MCIAAVYRVIAIDADGSVVVRRGDAMSCVSVLAADEAVTTGDWVLVHSGLVLRRLNDADVQALEELTTDGSGDEPA